MYDARDVDTIASAMIELTGFLNSPRQDEVLLRKAGVALDRALFPVLVRLHAGGTMGVAQLAEHVGRDPSTISRQLAKLEQMGLVDRPVSENDMRVRAARVTIAGARTIEAISKARREVLGELIQGWSIAERRLFPELLQRLAASLKKLQQG